MPPNLGVRNPFGRLQCLSAARHHLVVEPADLVTLRLTKAEDEAGALLNAREQGIPQPERLTHRGMQVPLSRKRAME